MADEPTDFEFALLTVAGFCMKCMNQAAVDDILIVAITPNGAMQFIGTGAIHPTNEEVTLSEGAILIFRSDLKDAVARLNQEAGTPDEASLPEGSGEQEEGANA